MKEINTLETLEDALKLIDYYGSLLDYMYDNIPCIDEVVEQFNETYRSEGQEE